MPGSKFLLCHLHPLSIHHHQARTSQFALSGIPSLPHGQRNEVLIANPQALEERFEDQSVTLRLTRESVGDVQVRPFPCYEDFGRSYYSLHSGTFTSCRDITHGMSVQSLGLPARLTTMSENPCRSYGEAGPRNIRLTRAKARPPSYYGGHAGSSQT